VDWLKVVGVAAGCQGHKFAILNILILRILKVAKSKNHNRKKEIVFSCRLTFVLIEEFVCAEPPGNSFEKGNLRRPIVTCVFIYARPY
jgi:hypothetical protein